MSQVLFVAVPGGRMDGGVPLSVVVVPRLDQSWADSGMATWVADVEAADLQVVTVRDGSTQSVPFTRVPLAEADLWQETFPATTQVRPWGVPAYAAPRVAPTAERADLIATTYEASAGAMAGEGSEEEVRRQLAQWQAVSTTEQVEPEPTPPFVPPDFHRTVSMLREHPAVLRRLGLILDLVLEEGAIPPGSDGTIKVEWPTNALIASPSTVFEVSPSGFFLPAASGDVDHGMVDLSDGRWSVTTVDVDNAVGRLVSAATSVASDAPDRRATLPTLRTAGLTLLRRDRAEVLNRRRQAAADHAAAPDVADDVFAAEDLVLGYRVDVRRSGGEWQSLTARLASYRLNERPVGPPLAPEEGQVKPHATTSAGPDALRADELVTRWNGWSLAVPRPTLLPSTARPQQQAALPVQLDWDFELEPESLPLLRFSRTYRLRVRVADLAGGGLGLGDPEGDEGSTELITFRRLEPVSSPVVTAEVGNSQSLFGPGGGVDSLVLRSDRGVSVADFAAANPQYAAEQPRSLTPPLVPLDLAEQHGALDDADDDALPLLERALTSGGLPDPAAEGVVLFVRADPGAPSPGATVDRSWAGPWPERRPRALRLAPKSSNQRTLAFEGDDALVRLAPAEQLTLEVSSLLEADHVDHFEISQWLRDAPADVVSGGRHPMATPARPVRFVHAVRKPLADPSGALAAQREPGATWATLRPSVIDLGLDRPSTGQLDVAAEWKEWGDTEVPVPRSDVLPPTTLGPLVEGEGVVLRHELGTTKHLRITYTPTAVSRFRQYFDASEPDAAFRASLSLAETRVPSTVRPPAPVIASVTPSFDWSGTDVAPGWTSLQRVREGGSLRVELGRPWYVTGEGERLAVLVRAAEGAAAPATQATEVSRDPIWRTTRLPHWPSAASFRGRIGPDFATGDALALPYAVFFADDRWWTDVSLPDVAGASYCPFVQLVVARFQPDSLPGLELSDAVVAEPVQLLPKRTLELARADGSLTATLRGVGPSVPTNSVEVVLERADPGTPTDLTRLSPDPSVPGWTPLRSATGTLGEAVSVTLEPGDGTRRVVVRETEPIATEGVPEGTPQLAQRTVFVDVVPLT